MADWLGIGDVCHPENAMGTQFFVLVSRSPGGAGRMQASGNDLGNRDWFWWQPGPETSPPPFRAPPPHPWGVGSLANHGEPPTRVGGVTGADGKRAGFSSGFQGAAWEADTPPPGDGGLPRNHWVLPLASRARECTGSGDDGGHGIHHEDAKGAKGKAKRFGRTGARASCMGLVPAGLMGGD